MSYSRKTRGLFFIFISAIMFGSYGIWSRLIGVGEGIFYPSWTRGLLIALALLPILLYKKQIVPIKRSDWKWMSVYLLATSLTQAPLFYAFNHMNIGTATLLFFVTMLLTMYAVGVFFLGEKLTKIKTISFALAFLGLYITFSFSILVFSIFAALMAILNGMASGTEVASSKKLTHNYSSLYVVWLSWILIAISNFIISIAIGERQFSPALNMFSLYQVGYAVAGILGFWLVIEGVKHVEASIGGLLGLLEVVFGILFGMLFFHEILTAKIFIGAVCIIFAAALPHVFELYKNSLVETKPFTKI